MEEGGQGAEGGSSHSIHQACATPGVPQGTSSELLGEEKLPRLSLIKAVTWFTSLL